MELYHYYLLLSTPHYIRKGSFLRDVQKEFFAIIKYGKADNKKNSKKKHLFCADF